MTAHGKFAFTTKLVQNHLKIDNQNVKTIFLKYIQSAKTEKKLLDLIDSFANLFQDVNKESHKKFLFEELKPEEAVRGIKCISIQCLLIKELIFCISSYVEKNSLTLERVSNLFMKFDVATFFLKMDEIFHNHPGRYCNFVMTQHF